MISKLLDLKFDNLGLGIVYLADAIQIKMDNPLMGIGDVYQEVANINGTKKKNIEVCIKRCIQKSNNSYSNMKSGVVITTLAMIFDNVRGLIIDTVKIVKEDDSNYTYETFQNITDAMTREVKLGWKKSKRYYGNLTSCLEAVLEAFIKNSIELRAYTPKEFIEAISTIKTKLDEVAKDVK